MAGYKSLSEAILEIETLVTETTATRTLALTDAGKYIRCTYDSGAITVTVPPNSSVAFEDGTVIQIEASSTQTVTIAEGSGVTIYYSDGSDGDVDIGTQYGVIGIKKVGTDSWVAVGDIA